jgi:hypothetical protein
MVGLASILIWLLSPVGGQSALRLLTQEIKEIQFTRQLRYLHPTSFMGSVMLGSSTISKSTSALIIRYVHWICTYSAHRQCP